MIMDLIVSQLIIQEALKQSQVAKLELDDLWIQ